MQKFRFTTHTLRARNEAGLALAKGQLSPLWVTTPVYMFSYIYALQEGLLVKPSSTAIAAYTLSTTPRM